MDSQISRQLQAQPELHNLRFLMDITGVDEQVLVSIALSALSPYQPGSLKQKLKKRQVDTNRDPEVVPTTDELWSVFEAADFKCSRCGSQVTVTLDRIDPNKGYDRSNIRVLCRDCNRMISRPNSNQQPLKMKVFQAIRDLLSENSGCFPTDMQIKGRAGIRDLSGSTYLVRFLRRRWEQKTRLQFGKSTTAGGGRR